VCDRKVVVVIEILSHPQIESWRVRWRAQKKGDVQEAAIHWQHKAL